jgi:hypothetical protein
LVCSRTSTAFSKHIGMLDLAGHVLCSAFLVDHLVVGLFQKYYKQYHLSLPSTLFSYYAAKVDGKCSEYHIRSLLVALLESIIVLLLGYLGYYFFTPSKSLGWIRFSRDKDDDNGVVMN